MMQVKFFLMLKKTYIANEYLVILYRFAVMMLLFSVCRIAFYLFNTSLFPNLTTGGFFRILGGGLKFDVSGLIYLNLLYIVLSVIPHPWKFTNVYQKILAWIFYLFNGIGIAANSIDFIYYRFILKRTTSSVFALLKSEENMLQLWGQFFIDFWYVAVFVAFMIFVMVKLYNLLQPKPFQFKKGWIYYPVSVVFLALFIAMAVIGIRGGVKHSTRPINLSNAGKYVSSPEEMAIVLNTPFCIIRTIDKQSFKKMEFYKDEDELQKIYTPVHHYPDSAMIKKNVVVLILESFNREFFGSLNPDLENGKYKGYTPFLDSLIGQSLVFPNAYANGRKSIDAMPSVIASVPALVLPYISSEYSSNKVKGLPALLGGEGYSTAFYHGAPNGSMGFQSFANLVGFDRYVGKTEYNNDADFDGMWGIWDEPFLQFFADQLTATPEPFYSTLFTLSSHHPFRVPEKYEGVFPKGDLPVHQCIGYSDNALRNFFEKAKKQDWYNNTLFVITADHSTVASHAEYKNNAAAFAVPLLFFTPDGSLKGRDESVAQQIDIMPTVLKHLRYNKPFVAFGNDLLGSDKRFAINYISGIYQLITDSSLLHFDGRKFSGLYDMKNDPAQKKNLIGEKNDEELVGFAKALIQQFNNRMIEDRLTVEE